MKLTKVFFITACLLFVKDEIQAQTITPEKRQQILTDFNDPDPFVRSAAVDDAAKYGITEAIPLIEKGIWSRGPGGVSFSLRALELLKAPNLYPIARALLDSADAMGLKLRGKQYALAIKVAATEYLYKFNDFSTTQYIFDILRDTSSVPDANAFKLLKSVVQKVPAYSDSAKWQLIGIVRRAELAFFRSIALRDLIGLYGKEMLPEAVYMFVNDVDPDGSNRITALTILYEFNYSGLHTLLQDRLSKEVGWPYRIWMAESLLVRYGAISDYQFVRAYQEVAPNSTEKSAIGKALQDFKPPIPSLSTPVLVLFDSLISYKHQVAALGWLGDEHFVKELDNDLENAQKHLAKEDSVNTAKEVEKFQDKIKKEYERTIDNEKKNKPRDKRFVTEEGYKFLFYNAKYIMDRLPRKK